MFAREKEQHVFRPVKTIFSRHHCGPDTYSNKCFLLTILTASQCVEIQMQERQAVRQARQLSQYVFPLNVSASSYILFNLVTVSWNVEASTCNKDNHYNQLISKTNKKKLLCRSSEFRLCQAGQHYNICEESLNKNENECMILSIT